MLPVYFVRDAPGLYQEQHPPPPRVFSEKRLEVAENKGNGCAKERKETTKRLEVAENARRATTGEGATQRARSSEHRGHRAEVPHPGCFVKRVWICLILKGLTLLGSGKESASN